MITNEGYVKPIQTAEAIERRKRTVSASDIGCSLQYSEAEFNTRPFCF